MFWYLDLKWFKIWKSNWKEWVVRLIEVIEIYFKVFLKWNFGFLFVDFLENDFCLDMSFKIIQIVGILERVVVDFFKDDSCFFQDSFNYLKDNSYILKDSNYCLKENSYFLKENSYIYV